jgi:hypothetical protein
MICAAAATLPATQAHLDADYIRRTERFYQEAAQAVPAGNTVDALTGLLATAVAPGPYVIRQQQVTLSVELLQRREVEFSVPLRLVGRPISVFYAARYATSESQRNRLTVTTVNTGSSPEARGAGGSRTEST